ncbi:hypothetical protein Gotri_023861 [Gossypium trilobum]|uniref:Uncharacterized protein n=1 Tax=Gossypium trilobum TaxID=34281 RepID=A0A7J9DKA0_9ROSI|nr:hypothetical protein [Gossypium trilobum]
MPHYGTKSLETLKFISWIWSLCEGKRLE